MNITHGKATDFVAFKAGPTTADASTAAAGGNVGGTATLRVRVGRTAAAVFHIVAPVGGRGRGRGFGGGRRERLADD